MAPKDQTLGASSANTENTEQSDPVRNRIKTDPRVPKSNMKPMRPIRGRFTHARVTDLMVRLHGREKFEQMKKAGVDKRMMFGTNPHYQALAMGEELRDIEGNVLVPQMPPSLPVAALNILPRLEETFSLEEQKIHPTK